MSDRVKDWPSRLEIDPSVFLASGAIVCGEVKIGARSSVWFHTVVRGDTDRIEIGADTNLQDLTMVHVDHGQPAIVGDRVTVGHRAILHGCVIESDVLIGMGAIVLSGAKVGTGSLVAAGALVREGQEIPAGSLVVGSPARVLGPVKENHREAIRSGAVHYAAIAQEYVARGFGQIVPAPRDSRGALGVPPAPMRYEEWVRAVERLAEGPQNAAALLAARGDAAFRRKPAPDRWSSHEVVTHLVECDAQIFSKRLDQLLTQDAPFLEAVDMVAYRRAAGDPTDTPTAAIETWAGARRGLVARLAGCAPSEWNRRGRHSMWGPFSLADVVRGWVDHDLNHRRQMTLAAGGPA